MSGEALMVKSRLRATKLEWFYAYFLASFIGVSYVITASCQWFRFMLMLASNLYPWLCSALWMPATDYICICTHSMPSLAVIFIHGRGSHHKVNHFLVIRTNTGKSGLKLAWRSLALFEFGYCSLDYVIPSSGFGTFIHGFLDIFY